MTAIHDHSLAAYAQELDTFSERARAIYDYLFDNPTPNITDRHVKDALFGPYADMNTVRPRITELVKGGWVVEVGEARDTVTNKMVRTLRARTANEMAERGQDERQMEMVMT